VCLHLNFETKNTKIGMLDSGCNNDIHRWLMMLVNVWCMLIPTDVSRVTT
jgi:hypothetical protein